MPTLGALTLATAILIDTRWILNEELGILGRSEEDAANDTLDQALAALNRSSDELAELAFQLGASPAHPEALADALTHEVSSRARVLLHTSGGSAAESFFFAACVLALRALAVAAGAEDAPGVRSVVAELTRALEKRLSVGPPRDAATNAAHELLPIWQDLAVRISA